jgi:hypothetical protein
MSAKYKPLTGFALSSLGVSYHGFGKLHRKGSRLVYGYFFKTDALTTAQREALTSGFQGVEFKGSSPAFALEIRSVLIVQRSRAEIARQQAAQAAVTKARTALKSR